MSVGVVKQCVGFQYKLFIAQHHIKQKLRVFSVGRILPVDWRDFIFVVDNASAFEVKAHIGKEVVVKTIGEEGSVAMLQAHTIGDFAKARQLGVAVVMKHVGINEEGVALFHLHVGESIHTILLVVEVGTVAIHKHIGFAKFYISSQHLIVVGWAALLIGQTIGVLKENFAFLIAVCTRHGGLYGERCRAEYEVCHPNSRKA